VVEGVQDQLCTALVNFEIDLVLSTGMPDMESVAEVSGCGWNERASVVAAAHHPIVRLPSPTLDTLISLPWAFMPKGTAPYARWSSQFIRAGLKVPHLAVATTSISLIKTLVRSGQFVSWLMEPMFREENERGVLRAVEVGGLSHTLQMRVLRRRDGRLSLPAVRFLDELRPL
jgi:LysR family transcriptional regulator of gallate degradation